MSNIGIITQLVPKNNANLAIADVNHLKGGFIQVDNREQLQETLVYTNRLKEGMLAFVVSELKFYQLFNGVWSVWRPESGASLVLQSVEKEEDLFGTTLEVQGQVVFVEELDALRYYTGTKWAAFSRIYIQNTPPQDTTGIWIDTTGEGLNKSSNTISELYKLINILARKVSKLEYMNQQIQAGDFSNNMFNEYDEVQGIDPESWINGIDEDEESDGTTEEEDLTEEELLRNTLLGDAEEPIKYKDTLPNVKHIQIKWGSSADMQKYKDNFLPAELLFCYNTNELWIKHPKTFQLTRIGATIGPIEPIPEDIMNGIIQDGDYIASISFVDMANKNKHYTFSVKNGDLDLYDESLNTKPRAIETANPITVAGSTYEFYAKPYIATSTKYHADKVDCAMIGLNAVYGSSYNKYNLCDFNFIEIANQTPEDVNLNGLYLHYTEDGNFWMTLPLKGILKKYSTFLIRGGRSADSQYAKVKIQSADLIWTKDITLNTKVLSDNSKTKFDANGAILFAPSCSFLLTGPLTMAAPNNDTISPTLAMLEANPLTVKTPWLEGNALLAGFMDLVGFGKDESGQYMPCISASMGALSSTVIYHKYYNLDPVSQAYKAILKADSSNSKLWTTLDLLNTNQIIKLESWNLQKGGHNLFFDKTLIESGKPSCVTCTFGYNPHTTRCFDWVSKGYRDEFIQYRIKGTEAWTTVESFKAGDGRSNYNNRANSIYNRIRSVSADGTYFTVHKLILDFPEPVSNSKATYEYRVGYKDNYTDIKTFTLRNRQDIINNGFQFVHITDQQGFNHMEYITWKLSAEYINKYYCDSYTYEIYDGNYDAEDVVVLESLPEPTSDSPEYVVIGNVYKRLDSSSLPDWGEEDGKDYWYQLAGAGDIYGSSSELARVITIPDEVTEESPEHIVKVSAYRYKKVHNDINFSINTGDATQNGNRMNEWLDYFNAGESLFSHLEQQYTVGNNDLCPIVPQEFGDGSDLTKSNPINVQYFFTFEHPFEIPMSAPDGSDTPTYIPCVYSFIYGNTYFLCMNSELTDSTNEAANQLFHQSAQMLYRTLKIWCDNDLTHLPDNINWKISYCHENPFTLLIYSTWSAYDGTVTAATNNRGEVTSHLNKPGEFWYSKFLEDNHFNLAICGHKHTYTSSYYLHDNPDDRMKPYVYDNGQQINDADMKVVDLTTDTSKWYVKYTMCQATGYKLVSNKELPCPGIGWLESYYPATMNGTTATVDGAQKFSHFIIWEVGQGNEKEDPATKTEESRDRIIGKVKKLAKKADNKAAIYKFDAELTLDQVTGIGGNGKLHPNNNVIVEKLPYEEETEEETEES